MTYSQSHHGNCCVGLWLLDESGGLAAKVSPVSRSVDATYTATGIAYGMVGPSGAIPRAIQTDGAAGYVTLPNLTTLTSGPQTWVMWFEAQADITSASAVNYLTGQVTSGAGLRLGSSTGTLTNEVASILDGAGNNTGWTGFTITAGWHSLIFVYDGTANGWTFYLDGTATGSKISAGTGAAGFVGGGNAFRIGNNGTTFYTVTTVAAVAVFSHQFTPGEACRIHSAGARNGYTLLTQQRMVG